MSSIVPGPQQKLEREIEAARSGQKPLNPSDLNPSAPPKAEIDLTGWPEPLARAVEAEHQRVTALSGNRRKTADLVVPELQDALKDLLDQIADAVRAKSTELPTDGAEILGIPDPTPPSHGDRKAALKTLKQLQTQLQDPDHNRLTRLTTFIIRLAAVVHAVPDAGSALAPAALDRYANALPDYQRDWPFPQKLDSWRTILSP
ncbi:hypothetical protein AB0E69_23940 [Kribbella sp. NPDC026611]|uniref:hypothetical protein n=1 Tax=Kribbella sp. NPDC026611 TaxID=3154911 RepID=UPI0033C318B4